MANLMESYPWVAGAATRIIHELEKTLDIVTDDVDQDILETIIQDEFDQYQSGMWLEEQRARTRGMIDGKVIRLPTEES